MPNESGGTRGIAFPACEGFEQRRRALRLTWLECFAPRARNARDHCRLLAPRVLSGTQKHLRARTCFCARGSHCAEDRHRPRFAPHGGIQADRLAGRDVWPSAECTACAPCGRRPDLLCFGATARAIGRRQNYDTSPGEQAAAAPIR